MILKPFQNRSYQNLLLGDNLDLEKIKRKEIEKAVQKENYKLMQEKINQRKQDRIEEKLQYVQNNFISMDQLLKSQSNMLINTRKMNENLLNIDKNNLLSLQSNAFKSGYLKNTMPKSIKIEKRAVESFYTPQI